MKEIFVVEDDEGIRELIEFLLISEQFAVKTFPNVRTFQKTVPNEVPDLFLLDIMLPDGNGMDLCKKLKENKLTSHVPVLLMSAHANISQVPEADDFIAKPFDVADLLKRIVHNL